MDIATVTLTATAPAKVNLALHVTARRADGYHDIESLVVFTRFGDRVQVAPAASDGFSVTGRYAADTPADEANLVVRARDALRHHAGATRAPPVEISLEKNLPAASGLGGGSSDAAATLRALNRMWKLEAGDGDLRAIGATLGADLPMCLAARPLVARGTGGDISILPDMPPHGLVLVNPGVPVATASVFSALGKRDNEGLPPLPDAFDFHSLRNWLETTRNDLEAPARMLHPAIGDALKALNKSGAAFARMSGSGATCFGLYETGNMAKRAAALIRGRHADWFVAATRTTTGEGDADGQG